MSRMFSYADDFKDQNLSNWNVEKVTKHDDFATYSGGNITEPNWQ
jgi:surface protein